MTVVFLPKKGDDWEENGGVGMEEKVDRGEEKVQSIGGAVGKVVKVAKCKQKVRKEGRE